MMKVSVNEIREAFCDLIHGKKPREQIANWAARRLMAEDANNLEYDPPECEDKIWNAILYLVGVDLLDGKGGYLFSLECFHDEWNELGLQKLPMTKNNSTTSVETQNAFKRLSGALTYLNKESLGKELKTEIAKGFDMNRLSSWAARAFHRFLETTAYDDEELAETLIRIAQMRPGRKHKKYQLTPEGVAQLADQLIASGEKEELSEPIPEIKESAIPAKDSWLMCPLCKKAWESASKYAMVRCPKCNGKLHNPEYGALTDKS